MENLKKRIEKLLHEKESCRNNDLTLCSEIWQQECLAMGSNLSDLSAVHFLHFISIGKLSKQQSILRVRRSLNNSKPETVGKSYKSNVKNKNKSSSKIVKLNTKHRIGDELKKDFTTPNKGETPSQHDFIFRRMNREKERGARKVKSIHIFGEL